MCVLKIIKTVVESLVVRKNKLHTGGHVQTTAGRHTFHSVSHKSSTKALCVGGSGPLNDVLHAATQTFLTDIQSGKFEPKQDGLLLAPPPFARLVSSNMRNALSGVLLR